LLEYNVVRDASAAARFARSRALRADRPVPPGLASHLWEWRFPVATSSTISRAHLKNAMDHNMHSSSVLQVSSAFGTVRAIGRATPLSNKMKTILALIALFSVALPASAAVAESFGATLPHVISLENALGLFVAAFAFLLFGSAYAEPRTAEGRRVDRLGESLPASNVFAARALRSSRRLRRTRIAARVA
jgi:hypothetical protein